MSVEKKWVIKEQGDAGIVERLAAELGVDPVLSNLLVQRGVTTYNEAMYFFRPSLDNLHDPFLMKDMDKAVDRVVQAINRKEKILIYGDYDVDGTTAVSLLYSFLKKYYDNLIYYIPDRYGEGYGISIKGIDYGKEQGVSLFIVLDCGIKSIEKIAYASSIGIDFIICDHHLPGESIPDAVAVLDPKRNDCTYPFTDLSGCGVGFKLLQAFCIKQDIPLTELYPFLDLVSVSIAADLVSVTGENRILAFYGLKQLNEAPHQGLKAIIKLSGLENHRITLDDVVFKIGPRINAAGRMVSGKAAVDLLTSESSSGAMDMGVALNVHNNDRKNIDRSITREAMDMLQNNAEFTGKKATVIYNPEWHKGVIGIVASRLIETYYRPTLVLTKSNGFITGSARSIVGFDLYQAVEACSDLLENFGGHTYAAGLTLKEENFAEFKRRFEEYADKAITDEMLIPQIDIDTPLDFKQITPKFFRVLKQFQPFGPGNMSPVFLTENIYDNGNGRAVGQENGHLKLELIDENEPYRPISAIAFNQAEHFEHIKKGSAIDVCYSIAENNYMGIANIQLRIKDIKERQALWD